MEMLRFEPGPVAYLTTLATRSCFMQGAGECTGKNWQNAAVNKGQSRFLKLILYFRSSSALKTISIGTKTEGWIYLKL